MFMFGLGIPMLVFTSHLLGSHASACCTTERANIKQGGGGQVAHMPCRLFVYKQIIV